MFTPITLLGRRVRLEPLTMAVVADLTAAANEDRSSYGFTHVPRDEQEMADYVAAALTDQAAGCTVAFAIRWLDQDRIVGSTRFARLGYWQGQSPGSPQCLGPGDRRPDVADMGYTWLAASAQRNGINTETKYLMLTHAFEIWEVHRVAIKVDARNSASRAAIENLGARLDGIIRADGRGADNTIRDTALYSILRGEWPQVRAQAHRWLAGRRTAAPSLSH